MTLNDRPMVPSFFSQVVRNTKKIKIKKNDFPLSTDMFRNAFRKDAVPENRNKISRRKVVHQREENRTHHNWTLHSKSQNRKDFDRKFVKILSIDNNGSWRINDPSIHLKV